MKNLLIVRSCLFVPFKRAQCQRTYNTPYKLIFKSPLLSILVYILTLYNGVFPCSSRIFTCIPKQFNKTRIVRMSPHDAA